MEPPQPKEGDELGELLSILSNHHRRRIVTQLDERNPREMDEFDLEEIAGGSELDDETIELVHNHIPRLAESGFVDWDRERQVVTRGPRFGEIEPLIALLRDHQDELPANWL